MDGNVLHLAAFNAIVGVPGSMWLFVTRNRRHGANNAHDVRMNIPLIINS